MAGKTTPIGYLDRFDRSKGWKKILFRPGYPVQSAELIEMQTLIQSEAHQIGGAIFKEGAAISGLSIVVNRTTKKVNIGSGQLYALGFVHDVPEGEVSIHGVGEEVIGVRITSRVITELDDITLKDVQVGSEAYGYAGSHRLAYSYEYVSFRTGMAVNPNGSFTLNTGKSTVTINLDRTSLVEQADSEGTTVTINNDGSIEVIDSTGSTVVFINLDHTYLITKPDGTTDIALSNEYTGAIRIAVLTDGYLDQTYTQLRPGMFDQLIDLLAERTYDESGSYTVEKFDIEFKDKNLVDPDYYTKIITLVKNGRAYVRGWRVDNQVRVLELSRPITSNNRIDEPEIYKANTLSYKMDRSPIRSFENITAIVRGSFERRRGYTLNGRDDIPPEYQPVAEIHRVYDVDYGDYSGDTDYSLNSDSIDWGSAGANNQPPPGGTYYVELDYVFQMKKAIREYTTTSKTPYSVVNGTVQLPHADIITIDEIKSGVSNIPGITVNKRTGVVTIPGSHSSADIRYTYWKHVVEGEYIARDSYRMPDGTILYDYWESNDYICELPSGNDFNVKTHVSFDTLSVIKPLVGSLVYYDYLYSLSRLDILAIDYKGRMSILKGIASPQYIAPSLSLDQMPICKIFLPAEARAKDIRIERYDNMRMTMVELRSLLQEVKNIQYNESALQLYQSTVNTQLPTDKRGVFADNFNTFDGADIGNSLYNAAIDILARCASLPQTITQSRLVTSIQPVDGYLTLSYKDQLLVSQPYATDTIQVNPYTYVNIGCKLTCNPKMDNFTNLTETTVTGPTTSITLPTEIIRNKTWLWQHGGWENTAAYGNNTRQVTPAEWQENARNGQKSVSVPGVGNFNSIDGRSSVNVTSDVTTTNVNQAVSQSVTTKLASEARTIDITLTGEKFIPNEDNLACQFDGQDVPLIPVSPTRIGTRSGSIKANADGSFVATVTIPAKTKVGTHSITVIYKGDSTGIAGSRASTTFSTQGINKHIVNTVTITEIKQRTIGLEDLTSVDPIAQTFKISSSKFITKIGIYFKSKPSASNVWVEALIVPTDNGIPTDIILGKCTLQSQNVLVSSNASLETMFKFDHPVYLEKNKEYATIIKTDTSEYSVFISRMNQEDPVNGWVNKNPVSGVLMTSANMSTWSAEQNADLKFNLYKASFYGDTNTAFGLNNVSKTINFDPLVFNAPGISRFEIDCAAAEPTDKSLVQWQYSPDEGSSWIDFHPPIEVDMRRCVTKLLIRSIIHGDSDTSGVLHDSINLLGYYWKTDGCYIHREFELVDQDCRYVHLYVEVDTSYSNCNITPMVRFDDDLTTWYNMELEDHDSIQLDSTWWERHYIYDTGSNSVLHKKIQTKVLLNSTNNYQSPRIRKYRVIAASL
jgi:hypothetical protein